MRTKNTLKNIIMNFFNNILLYGLRFVSRIVFTKTLASVYLGVNGLLSNVLGILALTELGLGTAIGYSLYSPLAKGEKEKVKSLMYFYKKAYQIIALIVFVLGIVILPFLPFLIKDTTGINNLSTIYIIYLLNMAISYLFSYKRTLIQSDQKKYKIMPILMIFSIITSLAQIIVLVLFKNYILYLIIQIITTILENIFVNRFINKEYPYLLEKDVNKLEKSELSIIKNNIKALLLHKIGSYTVSSTDNLVISKIVGIIQVGIYSNYVLIINMINSFIDILTSNVISSFGNLIVAENEEKRLKVFKEMNFICFILYGISAICFIHLFNPFIDLAFGSFYVFSKEIVYIIVINNYIMGMINVLSTVQSASGLYQNDKYAPIIQSILNLIISIYLALKIGIIGVFIGTVVSSLIPFFIKPYIIYHHVFKEKIICYFKDYLKQIIILIISFIISNVIINLFPIKYIILDLLFRLLISVSIPSLIIFLFYRKDEVFINIISRIKGLIPKKVR